MQHPLLVKFDREFREYLESAIRYAELQTPYRPLDIEDEIRWLKEWLKKNTYARDEVVMDDTNWEPAPKEKETPPSV